MHVDAVVVGAGIVGASCAFFLTQGGLKVALVERGGIASGTSGSGEGNILVSDKEPGAELALAQQGCLLWKRLASILPDDFEFEEKGGVVVAETDEHLRALTRRTSALGGAGVTAHLLTSSELRELEPHLAHDLAGAAYFPQDAQVQPMLACAALVKHARQHGAVLLDHTEVIAVERDKQGGHLRCADEQGPDHNAAPGQCRRPLEFTDIRAGGSRSPHPAAQRPCGRHRAAAEARPS